MYGHSRTREEAITKAKSTLAVFLSEIEDQVKLIEGLIDQEDLP